ncbi:unnamed protein product [Acanthoscelides obtectus]|uniref:Fukutin-related protein n=1 Tax=Acanthoscelides obtectus TaxID=200917 RepID=A0A9P0PVX1_ACAOB|nr:unnamed protein product [Acanthoscelides obtectus]CAK1658814.1 Fukutin-related protein [Acanthoscelides obtectus]
MLYFTLRLFILFTTSKPEQVPTEKPTTKSSIKHVGKLITIILRDFELHENDVTLTVHSFLNLFPTVHIYILYDELPYPPLDIMLTNNTLPNVKFVKLSPTLKNSFYDQYPVNQIKTKYVLFVPDSTRLTSRQTIQIMINELEKFSGHIIAAPLSSHKKNMKCLRIHMHVKEWTLKYSEIKGLECDGVVGKHIILLETDHLREMSNAFLLPFPQSLYVQTSVLNFKVKIVKGLSFHEGKPILRSHHAQWKLKQTEAQRLKKLYNLFKIKQVVKESGITEWYGCTKDTSRCFGTVLENMPSYLYEKKWTPPCCLSNLRKTARYTFGILDESGIRYWLEAGSLLGAMRSGDILPWDHDVDVGFVREDLTRCHWLKQAKDRPVIDNKGFLWEKATEGNYYHVHFSRTNKIHVNLFPFYSKNGTMVRDSWFTSHRNMEFPENFLHPMSSIDFVGRSVPSPNNIRDFLEMKYGSGAIENPEYPDPAKLRFP